MASNPSEGSVQLTHSHFRVPGEGATVLSISQKRPCFVATLQSAVAGFASGSKVFVKFGETVPDFQFQVACAKMRAKLGMESVPAALCQMTRSISSSLKCHDAKGREMLGRLQTTADGQLPCVLMGAFEGVSGTNGKKEMDAFELLRVLLFRKYVGAKDTNLANVMVSLSTGAVLSVDETIYGPDDLKRRQKSPSLITAQNMSKEVLGRVEGVLTERPQEVATFVHALRSFEGKDPNIWTPARTEVLLSIDRAPPFDDASLAVLESGSSEERQRLARRLTRK